jgi:hypothetical protein
MTISSSFEIESYQGILNCHFGMDTSQIRKVLGAPTKTFKKTSTSVYPTDAFDNLGVHVFYKQPGVCEAIELFSPAQPTFQNRQLIGQPFNQLRDWLRSLDSEVEIDKVGLTSYQFGFGLYAPFAGDEPDGIVEAVIVFERGYYDS